MELGLKRGTVQLVPHDNAWDAEARKTAQVLREVLGAEAVAIEHIGSTAVPAICAKPILDLAVGVRTLEAIPGYNAQLEMRGFYDRGMDQEGQLLYVCGDLEADTRTHHIHVVSWGGTAWRHYLDFRDYLNEHPEVARQYQELKQTLARSFPEQRSAYTQGKQAFIDTVLANAERWRRAAGI